MKGAPSCTVHLAIFFALILPPSASPPPASPPNADILRFEVSEAARIGCSWLCAGTRRRPLVGFFVRGARACRLRSCCAAGPEGSTGQLRPGHASRDGSIARAGPKGERARGLHARRLRPLRAAHRARHAGPGAGLLHPRRGRGFARARPGVGQRAAQRQAHVGQVDRSGHRLAGHPRRQRQRIEIVDAAEVDVPGLTGQVANVVYEAKKKLRPVQLPARVSRPLCRPALSPAATCRSAAPKARSNIR
jgi:hypothetical protein